jgi:hypothetical protein
MITQSNGWMQMHTLAQRARVAGARRQRLNVRLSPEESTALADVLDAALHMTSAMIGQVELDRSAFTSEELAYLAMEGGGLSWLADEPELYSDDKLQERFEWTAASNAGR